MASSSSSSRSIPASLSQSWNYDVFLSFRGEDTRKNFVDHLYAALVQQGIHTYKDDETLPRGDSIGPSLLKAIQESRVAVVVLSENYANSSWCLDELTHIMDCMDKKGQIVMPVFYEIDPSDVRKQNGRYGESLAKHELENKKKVEIWKKALVKAGNLSGWVTKDFANGHEAKCIKDITGAISSKLILAPVTNHKKDLIGIETRLQDLKTKMEIGSGGVRMVGIWGVGGGGKTTLAHAAYSDIYHEFEAACFLENIRDESSKHGLKKLQENFLSSILKTKLKLESEIEGKSMIERRLCHKVVLVETEVLDMQSSVRHSHLPDVVANMNKLRWIRLKDYETSTFSSSNFHPTNLGCLMLTNCKQKRLWKGYKRLPGLKILDLSEQEPGNYLTKTPDFKDLPCLERLNLRDCHKLKEIHPSIGYHESLVWVSIKGCRKLKRFPPIIRMRKLETLILSWCRRLRKFPLIQTNMDSLECLHLDWTDIEMIPPTVGQLCTNLVTFNLSHCFNLRRIEGNFRLLKRLKYLDLYNCFELEQLAMDFFDEESSLEVLNFSLRNQYSTPNKNLMQCIRLQSFHQDNSMNLTLYQLPRCITKLSLSNCNLGDGDIPCDISELVTLQVLDLSYNKFSRLHSSLSRIPCLKHLKLSYCESLVELPDLPSSIAILEANFCDSLESIGDLSNCKWLWKVSLWMDNKLIDGERVLLLHSMLQVNAVEDRFMNVLLPSKLSIETFDDIRTTLITMQLPFNWYDDFSGFILHTGHYFRIETVIVIKGEMSLDSQYDQCEEFDENWEPYNEYLEVGYVPFGSLRHTSWWNSTYTQMSFQIHSYGMPKVKLVPRKSKPGDSREATTNSSDLWDEDKEDIKTFEIIDDSNSSKVKILQPITKVSGYIFKRAWVASLVNLDVSYSGLEIIPESVGQFCTNLVSLNLSDCYQLKRIEADFRLLKSLQDLDFKNCARLGQQSTSFASVSWEFTQFLCSIKMLCLSDCNLGDGDVPYGICDLLNLELLDLSANQFSRLDLSLSQIPRLKHLELSVCRSLVQLPDLPSSIAIVKANYCDSLQSVGDLSNYKRLWKVSLWRFKKLPGCERLLHSMLQVSAIEERFMHANLAYPMVTMCETKSVTLQLPDNWHSDFGGFLFCVKRHSKMDCRDIVIKHLDMSMGSQIPDNDYWDEFDQNHESNEFGEVGCVPFGSFRHVPWWSPASTKMISFEADDVHDFKVGLVPRKSKTKDDLMETSKHAV
ncbi:hypothetical protein QVD17_31670 [Tagetes erecta]|uniref:TIR domain-containing protein n=1 Tax=Tagetes erecta TaxID=13708 RepID=A0AAD8K490_TARER|nr:hypothetical protein QVD17_31670 [Tagetes erecta]